MDKKTQEDFKNLQSIFKSAHSKKHECLLCSDNAINSHVLQKNGILNLISSNNHVIQIKSKDFFSIDESGLLDIKSVGINSAMSYPLFCNFHDTHVFAPIEKEELNLNLYISQLLFSYRALCAEMRKKIINVDIFHRVKDSSHFAFRGPLLEMAKMQIEANTMGINDMDWFKTEFEKAIIDPENNKNYVFEKMEFDFIPVSVSAVYSPINPEVHKLEVLMNSANILNYIFINLIPQNNKLTLIIGYHKLKKDEWIMNYITSWKNINQKEFEIKLNDLLATKIETWCISPEYFLTLNTKNIDLFKKYWNDNAMNLKITQAIDFNIFE
ncbi:hypothetical protein DR871_000265 [Flavobacterium petrolei]|uniref:Uncharacterized protein n=1 Tax=Flavobacterium petrolei TaxID=2259594 RepID=A0A482TLW0_9FLAO|nr:hypothetical protein [Flavobacterium petrolei]RYJ52523.1 hypothetical protein DR871_000265 [Flavobacterium petrolei]